MKHACLSLNENKWMEYDYILDIQYLLIPQLLLEDTDEKSTESIFIERYIHNKEEVLRSS